MAAWQPWMGVPAVEENALPDVVLLANFGARCIMGNIVRSGWSW